MSEFPPGADEAPEGVTRRQALELAAFTAAMGLTSCFRPAPQELVPYAAAQPGVPGLPEHYATTLELEGFDRGLVITTYEHRPVKVEGNPRHPSSLGATGAQEQAALLGLFDSTRARTARLNGKAATRLELLAALRARTVRTDGGAGLRLLVEPSASPHRASLLAMVLERFPKAKAVPFSATLTGRAQEGARLAFGRALRPVRQLERARTVVSLDDDLLSSEPRTARDWVESRSQHDDARLWIAEASFSVTGMFADQRLRARPSRLPAIARALGAEVGKRLGHPALQRLAGGVELTEGELRWVGGAAADLVSHRGAAQVVASERQPPAVHALAHLLEEALAAAGQAVSLIAEPLQPLPDARACHELVGELQAGTIDTLVVTAWNPVFTALPELGLVDALGRAAFCLYSGLHEDETSRLCSSFAPARHPLECWGDGRARDGTVAIRQPVIAPLFDGLLEPDELFAVLAGDERPALEQLRSATAEWNRWLSDGVIPGTTSPAVHAAVDAPGVIDAVLALPAPVASGLELSFTPDLKVFDGRFGSNPWLQELPDPVTKLTWDNAALLSPTTAKSLGLTAGTRVRLELDGSQLEAPVLILPGHPDGTLTLPLGYGRGAGNGVASEVGFPATVLRGIDTLWSASGVKLTRLDGAHDFAITQDHWSMEGRDLALRVTRKELETEPARLEQLREDKRHLYPVAREGKAPPDHRWGMAIDLDRCTGCSACVIACQAENNIPAVGKENVRKGREMQWLRIDRYFTGDEEAVAVNQPLMCVHCEYAPCEYVCPVYATVHSDEGLNQMVYNRCVGTRYCSNNCPYKVRRFNYLEYTPKEPFARARQNPEVTVRSRGVMEKCSYCVQRIERARIASRIGNRALADGDIVTACQQACPTSALVFGDLADPGSRVSALHDIGRAYRLLNDLGTRPRTMHLARIVHEVES